MCVKIVGTGPGDPELLTLKAANILGDADIIYVPGTADEGRDTVEAIVGEYVLGAEILPCKIFMKDPEALNADYAAMADAICGYTAMGKKVCYAIPGDSMLYSTAWMLARCFEERDIGYEFIPGIPSFMACANAAALPLTTNRENMFLGLLPASAAEVADIVHSHNTTVFMKISKHLPALLEYISLHRPSVARLVHKVGMDGETITDLTQNADIKPELAWLAVVIIRQDL